MRISRRIARRARRGPPAGLRGIALIAVMWLIVLLTVVASAFAYSMRSEALGTRNALSVAMARAAADGAVERAVYELSRPRNYPEAWVANGETHRWEDGEITVSAMVSDESAKIDLNTANDALLKGLFQNVGGLDSLTAQQLLEAVLDWRDADDLRRPNGAEEPEYRAAGRSYKPSNSSFETVGELQRVLGMTPGLYARISETLTVYSRQTGINPMTASRDALLALPNVAPELIDSYLARRREAIAAKQPIPMFPAAQAYMVPSAPYWRIHAVASLPDGVTFVREAVLRPSQDPLRPLVALLWQEGERDPPPPADNSGNTEKDGTGAR